VACSRVNFTFRVVNSSVVVQYNEKAKRCITGKPKFDSKQRQKLGFCVLLPDRLWGGFGLFLVQLLLWVVCRGLSQRKREADYSPKSNAALMNVWVHTSNPSRFSMTNELTPGN